MKKKPVLLLIILLFISSIGGCSSDSVSDDTAAGPAFPTNTTTTPPITTATQVATIILTANPISVSSLGTVTITATLKTAQGSAVQDGTAVAFSVTNNTTALGTISPTATTVSGNATATFTANNIAGTVTITATSEGISKTITVDILGADVGSIEFSSAIPSVIGIKQAGQTETALIKFAVKDVNGQPVVDGTNVDFEINGPNGGEDIIPKSASTTGGFVQTTLQSGFVAGPVRIFATTTVNVTPISTSSTGVSIGGGVASATHFDLAASRLRLAGFAHTNLQSTITAFLADRFGNFNVLTGSSVSFFTEAGAVDRSKETDNVGIAPVIFRTQDPDPLDVPPATIGAPFFPAGESSYTCGGSTCNPRDGWATLLATTIGEEAFIDVDGNGLFDIGEPFTDLGEPFIDQNDNGTFDADEIFVDFDKNGNYSVADGQWNAKTMIWTEIRLTLTGTRSFGPNTSRFDDTNNGNGTQITTFRIPNGGFQDFRVFVSDFNQNLLPAGTTISITKEGGGKLAGGGTFTLADGLSTGPTVIGINLSDSDGETKKQEVVSLVVEITPTVDTVPTSPSKMILTGFLDFGPSISTTTLPAGTNGQSYNVIIEAAGGTVDTAGNYTWSANGIPAGLSITAAGEISGTITAAAGTYNFTITVTDFSAQTISDTKSFSLTVN